MKPEIELYSAPDELLTEHLERMLRIWKDVSPRFQATLPRLFKHWDEKTIQRMILLHDLGKATQNWQPTEPEKWADEGNYLCPMCEFKEVKPGKGETPEQALIAHVEKDHKHLERNPDKERGKWWREKININGTEKELLVVDDLRRPRETRPPHAQIGGAYLWWAFEPKDDLVMSSAFAIAIHHTDSALARPGVEDPATMLVTSGLVDESDDKIRWHEGLDDFMDCLRDKHHLDLRRSPRDMDVYAVSGFALELRRWARGATLLELHRRRLQVAALHSVIKVCDIRAAIERSEELVIPVNTFTRTMVNGGMIP